jgi:hypothetical protein
MRVRQDLAQAGFDPNDIDIQTEPVRSEGGKGFWESISDWLSGEETSAYRSAEQRGNCVVVVNTTGDAHEIDRAAEVMNRHHPIDIEACAPTSSAARDQSEGAEAHIPVVEERLDVGKRRTIAGGVRVYRQVTETPVEKDINLREEHVHVERRPADRAAKAGDFREETIGRSKPVRNRWSARRPASSKTLSWARTWSRSVRRCGTPSAGRMSKWSGWMRASGPTGRLSKSD